MTHHYIAMLGFAGCLPEYSVSHHSKQDAVDDLLFVLDDQELPLPKIIALSLKKDNYVSLDYTKYGADYAEIVESESGDEDEADVDCSCQ